MLRPAGRRLAKLKGLAPLLAGTALVATTTLPAAAQNATWLATPGSNDFSTAANWSPPAVPTGTAFFGTSNTTDLSFSADTTVGGWTFNPGASAYAFTNEHILTFAGAGIVVNGGSAAITNNVGGILGFLDSSTAGNATITNNFGLSFFESSTAGNATITNQTGGGLSFVDTSTAGSATITSSNFLEFVANSTAGNATITNNAGGSLVFVDSSTAGSATITNNAGGNLVFVDSSTAGSAAITNNHLLDFFESSTAGSATITTSAGGALRFFATSTAGSATITNSGDLFFVGTSTAGNATITNNVGGILGFLDSSTAGNATITNNFGLDFFESSTAGNATITNYNLLRFHATSTAGSATITNSGNLFFAGTSTAGNATITNNFGLEFFESSTGGNARFINNANGEFDISGLDAPGMTAGSIEGAGNYFLGSKQLTVGGNDLSTMVSGVISDGGFSGGTGGSLVKVGAGTLTLTGANTYSGGMTVSGGLINFAAANNFGSGAITLNGGGLQWAAGSTADISARLAPLGASGATFDTNGNDVTLATGLGGAGGLIKQGAGLLNLTANNSYTGPTTVNAGGLVVNGSLASGVILNDGMLGGSGTIGGLVANAGILAPGASIGTLTVNGNFTQNGGSIYQVEANAAGQSDRINVGGTAAINGGTVQVLAQPGAYARNTTYTILNATGGVSGAYFDVTSNFAFLTPSLSYGANDVLLTLSQSASAFADGARTANQYAVGIALDIAGPTATGDFVTVIDALSTLSTAQGPWALNAISGQNYAGLSNALVQGAQLFLTNFTNRAGSAGRFGAGGASRVALAEACDVACDTATPGLWGAWGGAVGGTGTIGGNANASTFTYSVAGFAAGLDRKFAPNFLAGVTLGYQTGQQWTGGFDGRSTTDTIQAGLYASFAEGPVYVDGIAGYAYSANQLWRTINIPGLQPRTAFGQTGANQFYGQLETGYRIELGGAAAAFVTPFARLQGSTATQNGFTETGAQSLGLNVAAQTTSSLRTVFGATLGGAMDLGWRDKLAAQFKLGWSHEFADTARPVSASFVGAPAVPFTVFGAAPQRDGVVVGFSAGTNITDTASLYLNYEGAIAGQDSSHALIAGLRMTW